MYDLPSSAHLLPRHIARVGASGHDAAQSDMRAGSAPGATPVRTGPAIRAVTPDDLPAITAIVAGCNLCKTDLLDDMTFAHFDNPVSRDRWLAVEDDGLAAVACHAPERLTTGTWALHLIAVHPERQGRGLGGRLLAHIERTLVRDGQRALLIGTSALPQYRLARAFYRKSGYTEVARIPDFYQAGDHQVLFRKAL